MKRHDGVCHRDQHQTKRRSWRWRPFVVRRHWLDLRLLFQLDRLVDQPVDLVDRLVGLVDQPVDRLVDLVDRLVCLVERHFDQRLCLD